MNLDLDKSTGIFTLNCTFDERFAAKNAGFKWQPDVRKWQTPSTRTAAAFLHCATPDARLAISQEQGRAAEAMRQSMATEAELDIPHPEDADYFPFQKAGIKFCLRRDPIRTLIGDEMGLGKTLQAIGTINMRDDIKTVLVVCPASLKLNWRRELNRWLQRNLSVGVIMSGKSVPQADILIVNYDILGESCSCRAKTDAERALEKETGKKIKKAAQRSCQKCSGKGFVIRMPELQRQWDLVVADECHRCKTPSTLTAKAFKVIADSRHRLALSGTPILNRPIEIHPILEWLDKTEWGNRWDYAKRYCGLKQTRFGTDMSGATNLEELRDRLRSTGTMIRRMKKDVLKELPPKLHTIIELPANGLADCVDAEWKAYRAQEQVLVSLKAALEMAKAAETDAEYQQAIADLRHGAAASFAEMSGARLELAKKKIPYIVTHLEETMEDVDKLVAFGHHTEVIKEVCAKLAKLGVVSITGSTSLTARERAVQSFQNDAATRLFVGNIIAAGVGLTLTAASNVVLFELDWRPGIVAQAIDRCHRIGQKDSVTAQYLVLEGSLDAYMAKKIAEKQKIIDVALGAGNPDDLLTAGDDIPVVEEQTPSTSTTRKEIMEKAVKVQAGDQEIALQCLRFISSLDLDYARGKNTVGWSKLDSRIGHSLAERNWLSPKQVVLAVRICNTHRRQLPDALAGSLAGIVERLK